MKHFFVTLFLSVLFGHIQGFAQARTVKHGDKYDTIIVKRKVIPAVKEISMPVPEYINQPYYYDKDGNRLL
ncbi:MAG: hypothetical protein EOO04_34470, partial [Chitinophagaceae bacterium]